jgi:hypothetical protein
LTPNTSARAASRSAHSPRQFSARSFHLGVQRERVHGRGRKAAEGMQRRDLPAQRMLNTEQEWCRSIFSSPPSGAGFDSNLRSPSFTDYGSRSPSLPRRPHRFPQECVRFSASFTSLPDPFLASTGPFNLLDKRAEYDAGKCTREELKAVEDEAIKAEVERQHSCGIKVRLPPLSSLLPAEPVYPCRPSPMGSSAATCCASYARSTSFPPLSLPFAPPFPPSSFCLPYSS